MRRILNEYKKGRETVLLDRSDRTGELIKNLRETEIGMELIGLYYDREDVEYLLKWIDNVLKDMRYETGNDWVCIIQERESYPYLSLMFCINTDELYGLIDLEGKAQYFREGIYLTVKERDSEELKKIMNSFGYGLNDGMVFEEDNGVVYVDYEAYLQEAPTALLKALPNIKHLYDDKDHDSKMLGEIWLRNTKQEGR